MQSAGGRRRGAVSWFVEPYRQVKLGLIFLIVNTVFSILIFSIFGYYVWDIYKTVSTYFSLSPDQTHLTWAKFTIPVFVGAGLTFAFFISTILISVRYTHQIYGPLVSIHRFLDQVREGETPDPLQLRESDQLKELAQKLNSLSERMTSGKRQGAMIPIYRYLDDLIAGQKPKPLQLRDGDHLNELVTKLNQLTEKS